MIALPHCLPPRLIPGSCQNPSDIWKGILMLHYCNLGAAPLCLPFLPGPDGAR